MALNKTGYDPDFWNRCIEQATNLGKQARELIDVPDIVEFIHRSHEAGKLPNQSIEYCKTCKGDCFECSLVRGFFYGAGYDDDEADTYSRCNDAALGEVKCQ